jgi:DNA-binding GntR family transcriptional regulator
MDSITLLTAVEQVAEHLRQVLLREGLSGTMPGVLPLAADLGVNHKTVKAALKQLEKEGWGQSVDCGFTWSEVLNDCCGYEPKK